MKDSQISRFVTCKIPETFQDDNILPGGTYVAHLVLIESAGTGQTEREPRQEYCCSCDDHRDERERFVL